ncbi:hypothetical protein KA977_15000 [Candidatus Dependentiae bacterium]|nr:hypothetical protein [Candidatus Dependentiae bacterium]
MKIIEMFFGGTVYILEQLADVFGATYKQIKIIIWLVIVPLIFAVLYCFFRKPLNLLFLK